jgi:hypothetical protein
MQNGFDNSKKLCKEGTFPSFITLWPIVSCKPTISELERLLRLIEERTVLSRINRMLVKDDSFRYNLGL